MSQAEIKTKLTADGSELSRALDQGIRKASDFRTQVVNIGKTIGAAFTAQAVIGFANSLADMADRIQDASGALGLSTDEMQAFDAAARRTAGGVDGFRAAIGRLVQSQADAIRGDDAALASMERIGAGNIYKTATTAQLVKALADYYKATNDLASVQDIMGKGTVQIREAFDAIANQSIPGLIGSFTNMGLVIESEGIKKLALFKDKIEELKISAAGSAVDMANGIKNIAGAYKFLFSGGLGAGGRTYKTRLPANGKQSLVRGTK